MVAQAGSEAGAFFTLTILNYSKMLPSWYNASKDSYQQCAFSVAYRLLIADIRSALFTLDARMLEIAIFDLIT
jgi:hypothetical protein